MPSNRVAALAAFLTGLAGCATSLAGAWPNSATNEIALIVGGVASIAGPISHVVGSWLWDRTPAGQGQQAAPFDAADASWQGVKADPSFSEPPAE